MNCPQCDNPIELNELSEYYNEIRYHAFCAQLVRVEASRLVAERLRKEKLWDENPWLWEFQKAYETWVEKTFNKPIRGQEFRYF